MKQGLYWKESPEPRFELFCERHGRYIDGKKQYLPPCNKLFSTEEEYEAHCLEIHDLIVGRFKRSYGDSEPHWHHKSYLTEHENFYQASFKLPLRPSRRFNVTQQMLDNLANRKCWCGATKADFVKGQVKFCKPEHSDEWWIMADYVGPHKDKFLRQTDHRCEMCGLYKPFSWHGGNLEVDHVIAIIFGGHPWDYRNLQTLCSECHKKKTRTDVAILAWWKRESDYDAFAFVTMEVVDPFQQKMELYC